MRWDDGGWGRVPKATFLSEPRITQIALMGGDAHRPFVPVALPVWFAACAVRYGGVRGNHGRRDPARPVHPLRSRCARPRPLRFAKGRSGLKTHTYLVVLLRWAKGTVQSRRAIYWVETTPPLRRWKDDLRVANL